MKNHPVASVLIIISIPVVLYVLFIFVFATSFVSWKVKPVTDAESKAQLGREALLPEIGDYVERTGMRGFQDVDLQIETREFSSLAELYAVFPESSKDVLKRAMASTPVTTKDIKGKKVKEYQIESVRPFDSRNTELRLDFSRITSESMEYWTWHYSIYEYKNGTYRFVVLESPM